MKEREIVYYRFKILFTMFSVVDYKRQNSAVGKCGKFAASRVRSLLSKKHTRRVVWVRRFDVNKKIQEYNECT